MQVELSDVRRAIERDEVVPCFQPIVVLRTGRLAGFEVLARWPHPQFGLILPKNFISLADENGLLGQLLKQTLKKALEASSALPEPLVLSVNVSPTQLLDMTLPDQIRVIAEESGFPLERLTVEITENALLNNLEQAQKIILDLKAMGCRLSLDDFGTGYSSLGHLQALKFDELKVDASFVNSMTKTRESRKIAAAIIGLGHSLGMLTVAEGIETEEQADMLLWLGCELGQGWFYGRPVPAEGIPNVIASLPQAVSAGLSTPGDGWAVSSLEALPTQQLAQLQAIYDGAPVGLCFVDRNLRYVSLNLRLAEMNGASVAAHLGRTVQEMIPASFPLLEPYLLRALGGEAICDVTVSRPANNFGEEEWTALLSYQPALDEADEIIGISIAVADITEYKRLEEAHSESADRQRNGFEPGDEVPWLMDPKGNSLRVSSQWVPAAKLSREKTRNLGWLEALHPEDLEATMKTMKEALRTGKPIDIQYRVTSIDGDWKWMRSRGSPRFGPSGEIIRWYGSVEHIEEHTQITQ